MGKPQNNNRTELSLSDSLPLQSSAVAVLSDTEIEESLPENIINSIDLLSNTRRQTVNSPAFEIESPAAVVTSPELLSEPGISVLTRHFRLSGADKDFTIAVKRSPTSYSVFLGDLKCTDGLEFASLKPRLHHHLSVSKSPSAFMETINNRLANPGFAVDYLSATTVFIDTIRRSVSISTAGHQPPLFRSWGRSRWRTFPLVGIPLGVRLTESWNETITRFSPGDKILLLSDGVHKLPGVSFEDIETDDLLGELDLLPLDASPHEILDGIDSILNSSTRNSALLDEVTAVLIQL